MTKELYYLTASQMVSGIRNKAFSVAEVIKAHLERIEATNQDVNAIVSLDEEKAMLDARAADEQLIKEDGDISPLFGLPIAIKDTHNAKGFPTTMGSPIFENQIAETDDIMTERLKKAGAIVIGKTNVPEFAAGSHTFNNVFGPTRNPYHLGKTAGGSSGGTAAALASGMVSLAGGSDMGGSCRNPAAYNNVVGLRPSPGSIPLHPKKSLYASLAVQGPLARTVSDTALMLSVVAGVSEKDPLSSEVSPEIYRTTLDSKVKGLKIGYSVDLGGAFPVDAAVRKAFERQLAVFKDLGCELEEASPDFTNATEAFQTLRAYTFANAYKDLYESDKDKMKNTVIWNIEKGLMLAGIEIGKAEKYRADLFEETRKYFETFDFLILPVSQVQPFDVDVEYPTKINDVHMTNYIKWMESCSHITVTGCPSISVPAGFCDNQLPFGLQIVAPYKQDFRLLQIAYAFEQATNYGKQRPRFVR